MKIYLLCPVRRANPQIELLLLSYVAHLEAEGHDVFYPAVDNPFETIDKVGVEICKSNIKAIKAADEVHVYWLPISSGSKFDLGVAFVYQKPIVLLDSAIVHNYEMNENAPNFATLLNNWPFGLRKTELPRKQPPPLSKKKRREIGRLLTKYWSKRK